MNPPLSLPVLIPLLACVIATGLFFSWRSSRELSVSRRLLLLAMRLSALAGVALLTLNFGSWESPKNVLQRPWVVMVDNSFSMTVADDGNGRMRSQGASESVSVIARQARQSGVPLAVHLFDSSLHPAQSEYTGANSNGKETRLADSLTQLLQETGATGNPPAGVIVLSDGRQTNGASASLLAELGLRAKAQQTPVHTLLLGNTELSADLALTTGRQLLTAFAGQKLRIPFSLVSTGLEPRKVEVSLCDDTGKELAKTTVDVSQGKPAMSGFDILAPAKSACYMVKTPVIPGEIRSNNNQVPVNVRVLNTKTRVFLAEGAPYWDSKFLAQLLRQQQHMDVQSVHRLTDDRYFRIDSDSADPTETGINVFPETAADLARYDLVILGKNTDAFLTPARVEVLRSYVRDGGGAVLFARGKPVSSETSALAALEPVSWGTQTIPDFRFKPTADGEAAGLFGQALPASDSTLWTALPTLKDARQIAEIKPFTRILAEGFAEAGAATGERFPVLLVRRYGQGVCGLVNGDGLWKWDFFPEARELGNSYEDFWIQLIQWMASYSEFLPGQDFSLRLGSVRGEVGQPVSVTISYRGRLPAPALRIRISSPDGSTMELAPAMMSDDAGRAMWRSSFTPDGTGTWSLGVVDPRPEAPSVPEAVYTVPAPAKETDDLSPDPEFLQKLAEATQGSVLHRETLADFLSAQMQPKDTVAKDGGAVWNPAWDLPGLAFLLVALFALEWWVRRRQGLA